MIRRLIAGLVLLTLAACADGARELEKPTEPLGDFKLGHAIVVTPNIVKGPVSREATDDEWIAALDSALETRFRRYEGDKFYHIGVSIEGYVLAQPGIPLVLSPKSVMILRATKNAASTPPATAMMISSAIITIVFSRMASHF